MRLTNNEVVLPVPGETRFATLTVRASTERPTAVGVTWVEVDAPVLGDQISVRARRNGDRFQPLGMAQEKKLQDFFVDARLPRQERDAVPLFLCRRGIAWVGGLRIAEWARPVAGGRSVFLSYGPSS